MLLESQIKPAGESLACAFFDYPLFTYILPDETERTDLLP
jgi:hypothetical protein